MKEIKKVLWHDTAHWEQLLPERAKISGSLIVTESRKKRFGQNDGIYDKK